MLHTPSEHIGSVVPVYGARAKGAGGGLDYDLNFYSPKFIVGNALAGDTVADCNYLDPGDGTGIAAALLAASLSPYTQVDIRCKSGVFTLPNGTLFTLAQGQRLFGAGTGRTIFVVPPGGVGVEPWRCVRLNGNRTWLSDISFAVTSINAVAASGNLTGIVEVNYDDTTVRDVEFYADGFPTFTVNTFPWIACIKLDLPRVGKMNISNVDIGFGTVDCTFAGAGFFSFAGIGSYAVASLVGDGTYQIPRFRDISIRGPNSSVVYMDGIFSRQIPCFDLDGLYVTGAHHAVTVQVRDPDSTTHGPSIRNVFHQMPPDTRCATIDIMLRTTAAGALETITIDGVRTSWMGAVGQTVYPISIWTHNTTIRQMRNVLVTNVQAHRTGADGTMRCEVYSTGVGSIQAVALSKVRLPNAGAIVVVGGSAGTVVDAYVDGAHTYDLQVDAVVTDAIVANNRIHNAFTDLGVGTSQSNNIIGP